MNKKKILGTIIALSLVTCTGFAAPLNDFSQGKVAVDLSIRPNSDVKLDYAIGGTSNIDGKTFWNYGITVGLGNNFAVEYRNADLKTKNWEFWRTEYNAKVSIQEFNVLYKLNQNFTVFTGINRIKPKLWDGDTGTRYGKANTSWQLGLTGQTPLADNLTGYATIAAGDDSSAWKLGVSYAIDRNLDFDVFYGWNKYKNIERNSITKGEGTIKGLGLGATYKF